MPATFPEALTHILEHPNVTLLPFIPEGVAIIPPIAARPPGAHHGTDRPVAEVMADMGAGVDAIMTDAGYPKQFPELIDRIHDPYRVRMNGTPSPVTRASVRQAPAPTRGPVGAPVDRFFLQVAAWPALVVMLAVTAIPFAITIGLAFTNYDLVRDDELAVRRPRQLRGAARATARRPRSSGTPIYLVVATTAHPDRARPRPGRAHGAAFRGIGLIRTPVPRAHHDRARSSSR